MAKSSPFVRQSRVRVRSALRGATFMIVLSIHGRPVFVAIERDQREAQRLEVAKRLVARQDDLARAFDAFTQAEATRRPDCADEIRALELDLLSFGSDDCELGEVSFTYESSRDAWSCSLRDFTFFDLTEEQ